MTAAIALLLAPFALLTAFFVVEVLVGLASSRRPVGDRMGDAPTAVILVPAHNESAVIAATLQPLTASVDASSRILVIADNCTDETARCARDAGVEVIERNDPARRGKGFALEFAAEQLQANPPNVIVVIDADCFTDAASIRALIAAAASSGRPCQAVNLLRSTSKDSPLVQLSAFAFLIKNLVRQRGLQRLAWRAHLTGTGMALPFKLFRHSSAVGASIVEDLSLGLELARQGHPPLLVEGAMAWSRVSNEGGTLAQRQRWEGGFLAASFHQARSLLRHGLKQRDLRSLFAALDLLVPPLALFGALNLAALTIAFALTILLDLRWWPVLLQTGLLAAATLALLAAWFREGREIASIAVLARLPLYLIWKIPMYWGFLRRGAPKDWLRSGRS